ncbi:MAG: pilus assembly protein TadG-related protein, partial [Rhodobacteraceae bacterium]|nr:pilus assembly protein TadG-related protein [Paracoccaceae bacterium]
MRRTAAGFARDEDGAILVIGAGSLGMIRGMIALSYDLGRMAATQSELQSYADHVALAAAGELDGVVAQAASGTRHRARAATRSFISGAPTRRLRTGMHPSAAGPGCKACRAGRRRTERAPAQVAHRGSGRVRTEAV